MRTCIIKSVNISDISIYRQTLMGIGIIGVLIAHWHNFQNIDSGISYSLGLMIGRIVFTQGFLFLSGFGLYYSFSSCPNIKRFYSRRIIRLYYPFLLMSVPLYTYFLCNRKGYDITDFVTQLLTIYFWIKGNFGGMWYVSLSIFLYLLFPVLYNRVFNSASNKKTILRVGLCVLGLYLIIYSIQLLNQEYYNKISIGVDQIIFFIIGVLFGYEVRNKLLSSSTYMLIICSIGLSYLLFSFLRIYYLSNSDLVTSLCSISQKLALMPIICILLNLGKGRFVNKIFIPMLNWFGAYSLELYILHLHVYMLLSYGALGDSLSPFLQASVSVLTALILCVPIKKVNDILFHFAK